MKSTPELVFHDVLVTKVVIPSRVYLRQLMLTCSFGEACIVIPVYDIGPITESQCDCSCQFHNFGMDLVRPSDCASLTVSDQFYDYLLTFEREVLRSVVSLLAIAL